MKTNYDYEFEVGTTEKHRVAFHWGQWWGLATITVDGAEIHHERHNFSLGTLTRVYEASVGVSESHAVRIEKTRPRFFGARPRLCTGAVKPGGRASLPKMRSVSGWSLRAQRC